MQQKPMDSLLQKQYFFTIYYNDETKRQLSISSITDIELVYNRLLKLVTKQYHTGMTEEICEKLPSNEEGIPFVAVTNAQGIALSTTSLLWKYLANATVMYFSEKEDIHFSFANGYCNENGKDSAAVAKEIYNDLFTTTILREIPTDIWKYYYNTMWQHLVLYNNHNYMIYNPVVEYYHTGFPLQKEEILCYGRNYIGTLVVHENYNMPGILQYTPSA